MLKDIKTVLWKCCQKSTLKLLWFKIKNAHQNERKKHPILSEIANQLGERLNRISITCVGTK
jgi:hypothetical protein